MPKKWCYLPFKSYETEVIKQNCIFQYCGGVQCTNLPKMNVQCSISNTEMRHPGNYLSYSSQHQNGRDTSHTLNMQHTISKSCHFLSNEINMDKALATTSINILHNLQGLHLLLRFPSQAGFDCDIVSLRHYPLLAVLTCWGKPLPLIIFTHSDDDF